MARAFRSRDRRRSKIANYTPAIYGADRVIWDTLPQYLCNNAGTLLEDFELASDWVTDLGAAPVDDAVKYVTGASSITWSPAGTNHRIHKVVSWDLSVATDRDLMEFWIYATGTGALEIFLSNLDTSSLTKYIKGNPTIEAAGRWQCCRIALADWSGATGGFSWSLPILSVHFRYSGTNVINLDSWRKGLSYIPAVVTSWDDCLSNIYTYGLGAFNSHNASSTVFMVGDYIGVGSNLTAAHLQALQAAGWVIGNHTDSHPHLNTLTQAQIETQFDDCAAALTAAGVGAHGLHYAAYPWGEYDADIEAASASKGFRYGRLAGGGKMWGGLRFGDGVPATSLYRIPSNSTFASLGALTAYIDWAKKYQAIAQTFAHDIDPAGGANKFTPTMLDQYLAYIAGQGVYHLTFEDLYQLSQGPWPVRRLV